MMEVGTTLARYIEGPAVPSVQSHNKCFMLLY